MRQTRPQWCALASATFRLYSSGGDLSPRPRYEYSSDTLRVFLDSLSAFESFTRQLMQYEISHTVHFSLDSCAGKEVEVRVTSNNTPPMNSIADALE